MQRAHLRFQPAAARGLELGLRELREQRVGIVAQTLRVARLLRRDARRELGRPVVRLDEVVGVLADA